MPPGQLFEELGFTYSGPFDGHNINQLRKAIRDGIARRGPVLIHVHTQKGKGYGPAERNPTKFHGVGPAAVPVPDKTVTFSEVFGATLLELGKRDESIVAVTAAMKDGTGLGSLLKLFPAVSLMGLQVVGDTIRRHGCFRLKQWLPSTPLFFSEATTRSSMTSACRICR